MNYEKAFNDLGVVIAIGLFTCIVFPTLGIAIIVAAVAAIFLFAFHQYFTEERALKVRWRQRIAERADLQHAAVLRGEAYGMYGDYKPYC